TILYPYKPFSLCPLHPLKHDVVLLYPYLNIPLYSTYGSSPPCIPNFAFSVIISSSSPTTVTSASPSFFLTISYSISSSFLFFFSFPLCSSTYSYSNLSYFIHDI